MSIELLMMKAQINAFRNLFLGMLGGILKDSDEVWLRKYQLWEFEREHLLSFQQSGLSSPDQKVLEHRRLQLEFLMNIAYIAGNLENYELVRYISPESADLAKRVYQESDKTEQSMLSLIDKLL